MNDEYDEYRCSACKKAIKNQVVACKSCVKLFYHPDCVSKHKIYDINREMVSCPGPFEKFTIESEADMKKATAVAGSSRDRLGSTGSIGRAARFQPQAGRQRGGGGSGVKLAGRSARAECEGHAHCGPRPAGHPHSSPTIALLCCL